MTPRTIHKTKLTTDPDRARAQLEGLGVTLTPAQVAAGERLRAVAVELIQRGLQVTVVNYQDAWEQWTDIADEAGPARAGLPGWSVLGGQALHVCPLVRPEPRRCVSGGVLAEPAWFGRWRTHSPEAARWSSPTW